jgi:hypothetical protein
MCELNDCRSLDAPCAVEPGSVDPWEKIEDRFRMWSFQVYYRKSLAEEHDLRQRFIKALRASCQPIRNRELVYEWYRKRQLRYRPRHRHKHAHPEAIPV